MSNDVNLGRQCWAVRRKMEIQNAKPKRIFVLSDVYAN